LIGALILLAIAGVLSAISRDGSGPDTVPDATTTAGSPVDVTSSPTTTSAAVATVTVVAPDLSVDPAQLQPARVVDIVDGDTIDVEIDGVEERIRYYGIDTPERGDACFSEASARNEELIAGNVLLLSDARNRDRSGRLLRYVFDAEGASVDARLIVEGLALAWRDDGTFRNQLVELEEQTRTAGVGCLWEG